MKSRLKVILKHISFLTDYLLIFFVFVALHLHNILFFHLLNILLEKTPISV